MLRLLSFVTAAAALVCVPAAHAQSPADRYPADGVAVQAAKNLSASYWADGAAPCGGRPVTVSWISEDGALNARASWTRYSRSTDPAEFFDCRIAFNKGAWGEWTWPKFCTVMVHEMGHLYGHPHSDGGVMDAYYKGPIAECETPEPTLAPVAVAPVPTPPPAAPASAPKPAAPAPPTPAPHQPAADKRATAEKRPAAKKRHGKKRPGKRARAGKHHERRVAARR